MEYDYDSYLGGGGNGGGYMNTFGGGAGGYGGGSSQEDSMVGGNGKNREEGGGGGGGGRNESITPLTIRMVNASSQEPDDTFKFDGRVIQKVNICGRVIQKVTKTTNVTYVVSDGTGFIECVKWIEADEPAIAQAARNEIVEGATIMVHGPLKVFGDKKQVQAFHVKLIRDFNERTHHFLQTIYVHLQITKGPLNKSLDPMAVQASHDPMMMSYDHRSPMKQDPGVGGFNPYTSSGMGNSNTSMNVGAGGFNAQREAVLKAFARDNGTEAGLSISDVAKVLAKQGISLQEIKRAVEFLTQEGHIYSTVDDDHYKTTDSG